MLYNGDGLDILTSCSTTQKSLLVMNLIGTEPAWMSVLLCFLLLSDAGSEIHGTMPGWFCCI